MRLVVQIVEGLAVKKQACALLKLRFECGKPVGRRMHLRPQQQRCAFADRTLLMLAVDQTGDRMQQCVNALTPARSGMEVDAEPPDLRVVPCTKCVAGRPGPRQPCGIAGKAEFRRCGAEHQRVGKTADLILQIQQDPLIGMPLSGGADLLLIGRIGGGAGSRQTRQGLTGLFKQAGAVAFAGIQGGKHPAAQLVIQEHLRLMIGHLVDLIDQRLDGAPVFIQLEIQQLLQDASDRLQLTIDQRHVILSDNDRCSIHRGRCDLCRFMGAAELAEVGKDAFAVSGFPCAVEQILTGAHMRFQACAGRQDDLIQRMTAVPDGCLGLHGGLRKPRNGIGDAGDHARIANGDRFRRIDADMTGQPCDGDQCIVCRLWRQRMMRRRLPDDILDRHGVQCSDLM